MSRPRLLDLFCGAGGASMGYFRAGFDVVGIDLARQPRYPFAFVRGDALNPPVRLESFDAIHASPPCQAYSRAGKLRDAQGGTCSALDLLEPTRAMLEAAGRPYIIENVPGAPLDGVMLCGSMFGLAVRRHRIFETRPFFALSPPCDHAHQGRPIGVYHRMNDEVPHGGRTARTLAEGQDAMGIDWMEWDELKESIPPAFTEWLGLRLLEAA